MERESFVFYRSFYEGIKELPRDIQGEVLTAIMEYGLNGVTTENQKQITKAMFALIKPQLDANNQRFENGKKGGRPKANCNQTETETKPKQNRNKTKHEPNVNVNDNVNDNNISFLEKKKQKSDVAFSDLENENENSESPIETLQTPKEQSGGGRKRFAIPTPEEVQAYCDERKNGISGQQFCDFYGSKGWRVGSQPMKDWKAAVRTWEMRRKDLSPSVAQPQPQISTPKRIRFDEYGNEVIY
nr:MAG TPA: hypothetical protein [Caudoviricetes sp.]